MNEIEVCVANIIEDFKNTPEIQAAWDSVENKHEYLFNKWSSIITETLSEFEE